MLKVWHYQHRCGDHCRLEKLKRGSRLLVLVEALLGEELGKRLGDDAIAGHGFPVVARVAQETVQLRRVRRHRPLRHGPSLLFVRGDAFLGDHVADVVDVVACGAAL